MKRHPEFWHIPTGCYRQVIGARNAEAGKVFATITRENAVERLFLLDSFDPDRKVEIDALWEKLWLTETARIKAKARKDKALENMRHARAATEAEDEYLDQQYRDLGEESSPEYEPEEPLKDSEIIAPADSFGLEPLPEIEEEEIEKDEVLED